MKYLTDDLKKAIIEDNKEAIKSLNEIKKGIYLHVFQPSKDVYEIRKSRNHIMKTGTTILKPGKFTNGLYGRFKGYSKCWKYQTTNELCFLHEVKSYLLVDLSEFENDYVARVEAGLISIIHYVVGKTEKYEKGSKSEYRELKGINITHNMIENLTNIIKSQIKNDMNFDLNNIVYKGN